MKFTTTKTSMRKYLSKLRGKRSSTVPVPLGDGISTSPGKSTTMAELYDFDAFFRQIGKQYYSRDDSAYSFGELQPMIQQAHTVFRNVLTASLSPAPFQERHRAFLQLQALLRLEMELADGRYKIHRLQSTSKIEEIYLSVVKPQLTGLKEERLHDIIQKPLRDFVQHVTEMEAEDTQCPLSSRNSQLKLLYDQVARQSSWNSQNASILGELRGFIDEDGFFFTGCHAPILLQKTVEDVIVFNCSVLEPFAWRMGFLDRHFFHLPFEYHIWDGFVRKDFMKFVCRPAKVLAARSKPGAGLLRDGQLHLYCLIIHSLFDKITMEIEKCKEGCEVDGEERMLKIMAATNWFTLIIRRFICSRRFRSERIENTLWKYILEEEVNTELIQSLDEIELEASDRRRSPSRFYEEFESDSDSD
ncbi:hypothetical protein BJ508DRAFT_415962 [Ascobolus immersus RN42]|uniref:Uncharacterized protein n=1 Tax=Ascobolus immersus RN42 TaxID=1160509 RepID=A0A3N4IC91_ASCIM|nr:hypothetical protein BJ508DRAFT_415962 [Ascobolus immersus RN42]